MPESPESPQSPEQEPIPGWLSIPYAAHLLQTHPRTLERNLIETKRVEVRHLPRPGKKPQVLVNKDDIERRMPKAHVMPEEKESAEPALELAAAKPSVAMLPFLAVLEKLAAALQEIAAISAEQKPKAGIAEIADKLVLSPAEAMRLGFSRRFLKEAIATGELKHFKDGTRVKIPRASLEEFAQRATCARRAEETHRATLS